MTNRQKFLNYVKDGGDKFICSPQIGGGAGFDAKMSGKGWLSDPTFEDTKKVCEMFDMVPLYNFGLPDLTQLTPDFKWVRTQNGMDTRGRRVQENSFETPHGVLVSKTIEEQVKGGAQVKYPVTDEGELGIVEYYLDALLDVGDFSLVSEQVGSIRKALGEEEPLDIQWSMQPYELMCFPDTMNTAIFAMECPELFKRLMDKILRLDERLLKAVAEGGADFVFLGGPGSEMISPRYYEDYLVPYSKIITDMAHENGLLIYSHICSPIEPMLTMGYYDRMGIDLFETLSEAPVGNVRSIADAFSKISPGICTRGNIGLDSLLQCKPREIREMSLKILETAAGMNRKHILAASDYLFYDTPAENVHAMCEAVREFNGG